MYFIPVYDSGSVCSLFQCYVASFYGFFRVGLKIIWIYVGLVRDVCGLLRVCLGFI